MIKTYRRNSVCRLAVDDLPEADEHVRWPGSRQSVPNAAAQAQG